MAFLIEKTWYNGYRCSCCERTYESSEWVDTLEESLAVLPTEFPPENDGGTLSVIVKDGSTGKEVASSKVSFAPNWQRGDAYRYTTWTLFIDEEFAPNRGTYTYQIIEGTNYQPSDPNSPKKPLKLITDKSWSDLCDELREAKIAADIRKAKADKESAEKRLAALQGVS